MVTADRISISERDGGVVVVDWKGSNGTESTCVAVGSDTMVTAFH